MSKSLKIKTFGARGNILCQQIRIDEGLKLLGHKLVDENPELIFANDFGSHKEAIECKRLYPAAKLILSILDLPFHVREINDTIASLTVNFQFADAVTTISNTVAIQMLNIFPGLQKRGIGVIYQPIKNVYPLNLERNSNLLFVSRACDSNKRFLMALELAGLAGVSITVVGHEDPNNIVPPNKQGYRKFINYIGEVTDDELNVLYNTHAAVMVCGRVEGLSLSLIEGIATKTPVVCLEDMATSKEFCPDIFISRPNLFDMYEKLRYVTSGATQISKVLDEYSERYLKMFSPESVANNIVNIYEKLSK